MKRTQKKTHLLSLAALLGLLFPLGMQAQYSGGIGKGDARALFRGTVNGPQIITQMVFTVNPPSVEPAQFFQAVVELRDASGNLAAFSNAANASVSMAIANNPGAASLSGSNPVNAIDGLASFSLSIDAPGLGYTLQATSGALSTTSTAFNVLDIDLYQGGIGKGDARAAFSSYRFNGSWSPDNPDGITTGTQTVNTLVIESGAASLSSATNARRVEIAPGASLEATNLSLSDSLFIQADATGYGMYKGNAQNVRMQQYVANTGWHNMALPVSGNLDQFGRVNTARHPNTRNIYSWDATNGQWVDVVGANNGSNVANAAGTGYNVYVGNNGVVPAASVIDAKGPMVTSATPILVYNTGSADPNIDGWNFIGNPLTCALDFTQLAKSNVLNSYSIWDANTQTYKNESALSNNAKIPPMQGFWVKASGSNPSISGIDITGSAAIVNEMPTFYKTAVADRFYVQVAAQGNPSVVDDILIGMVPGTSDGIDAGWDAAGLLNPPTVPTLLMMHQNIQIAHNAIDYGPQYTTPKQLPLHFSVNQHGAAYTFNMYDSLLANTYTVVLEDQLTGVFHDFSSGSYSFINDVNASQRFMLHLAAGKVSIDEIKRSLTVQYRIEEGSLVLFGTVTENKDGALYTVNGQCIQTFTYRAEVQEQRIPLTGLTTGVYVLQIGTETHKVFVP